MRAPGGRWPRRGRGSKARSARRPRQTQAPRSDHLSRDRIGVHQGATFFLQHRGDARLPEPIPPVTTTVSASNAYRRPRSAGDGEQDEGRLVDLVGDEEVVGCYAGRPSRVPPCHELVRDGKHPGVRRHVPRARDPVPEVEASSLSTFAARSRLALKSPLTASVASSPPTQTSSKNLPSIVFRSSGPKRCTWKGFSKSAGAFG